MANLFDYIEWRGDLTFAQAPFNVVDGLILCSLCYVSFDGVVPSPAQSGAIPLQQAAEEYFAKPGNKLPPPDTKDFDEHNLLLLDALSKAPRFAPLALSAYVNELDTEAVKQFSALTIDLGGGEGFVAFRGTDSTLVGWKEDFEMAFLPKIPSQQAAASYLSAALPRFAALRVGGHSKGGNLAVYAATCAAYGQNIKAVYNNDGPGFSTGLFATPAYKSIRSRIHTFVPQSSVVGMLLDHEETYTVVRSTQVGLLQHDPYSWQVLGADFVRLDTVTDGSRFLNLTLRDWLASMDAQRRQLFVDALFDILGETDATTTAELGADWLKSAGAALQAYNDLDEESRDAVGEVLHLLLDAIGRTMPTFLHWNQPTQKWLPRAAKPAAGEGTSAKSE